MRKSLDGSTAEAANKIEIDRDALVAEELDKLPKLDPDDSLIQIHTSESINFFTWKYKYFYFNCPRLSLEK